MDRVRAAHVVALHAFVGTRQFRLQRVENRVTDPRSVVPANEFGFMQRVQPDAWNTGKLWSHEGLVHIRREASWAGSLQTDHAVAVLGDRLQFTSGS